MLRCDVFFRSHITNGTDITLMTLIAVMGSYGSMSWDTLQIGRTRPPIKTETWATQQTGRVKFSNKYIKWRYSSLESYFMSNKRDRHSVASKECLKAIDVFIINNKLELKSRDNTFLYGFLALNTSSSPIEWMNTIFSQKSA